MWKSRGQSITDRLLAARYTLTGQDITKSVCKATTEQPIAPKKKHLDYLTYCSSKPNVQIAELANVLVKRARSSSWIVVFKTLITTHYILIHGSERVLHYLASCSNTFELDQFLDRNCAYGFAMSPYVRRYAKYLNRKVRAYRTAVYDFCKVQRGRDTPVFATMSDEVLLDTLTLVQDVLDTLLHFGCSADDLNNEIIITAVKLLFRDLIRLFVFYNEGVINLLRRYFDMKKKQCEDALTLYKNFLTRLELIPGFVKVCEATGVSCGGLCELRHAPDSLLDTLEQHLCSLRPASHVLTPTHVSRTSFPPYSGTGTEMCNVTFQEPECSRPTNLGAPPKLDFIYDDPLKMIRNPFVTVELLATKPALSPADVCSNYVIPSYVPPTFVSDRDFAAAFRQAETSHETRNLNAARDTHQENLLNVGCNFSFNKCASVAGSRANFLKNTTEWWPQQLTSKTDSGYLPMRASTSNQICSCQLPFV